MSNLLCLCNISLTVLLTMITEGNLSVSSVMSTSKSSLTDISQNTNSNFQNGIQLAKEKLTTILSKLLQKEQLLRDDVITGID